MVYCARYYRPTRTGDTIDVIESPEIAYTAAEWKYYEWVIQEMRSPLNRPAKQWLGLRSAILSDVIVIAYINSGFLFPFLLLGGGFIREWTEVARATTVLSSHSSSIKMSISFTYASLFNVTLLHFAIWF